MPLIKTKELCAGYNGVDVIHDVNLVINSDDYLCFVGDNGSGKSTLIKALLGTIQPSSGVIVRRPGLRLGYVPQKLDIAKDFPATVREVVMSGNINGMGRRLFYIPLERVRVEFCLDRVGMLSMANKPYNELSGGQQQRVLLARALCASLQMIVLDEPSAGLDPETTHALYDILYEIHERGTAIVMVTHDANAAHFHGTRVMKMIGGKLQCS
jgi:zinc transport system ATP-binding protein